MRNPVGSIPDQILIAGNSGALVKNTGLAPIYLDNNSSVNVLYGSWMLGPGASFEWDGSQDMWAVTVPGQTSFVDVLYSAIRLFDVSSGSSQISSAPSKAMSAIGLTLDIGQAFPLDMYGWKSLHVALSVTPNVLLAAYGVCQLIAQWSYDNPQTVGSTVSKTQVDEVWIRTDATGGAAGVADIYLTPKGRYLTALFLVPDAAATIQYDIFQSAFTPPCDRYVRQLTQLFDPQVIRQTEDYVEIALTTPNVAATVALPVYSGYVGVTWRNVHSAAGTAPAAEFIGSDMNASVILGDYFLVPLAAGTYSDSFSRFKLPPEPCHLSHAIGVGNTITSLLATISFYPEYAAA